MRTAVTETSIDAFHEHRGSGQSSQQRNRILEFIKSRGGDWCIGELAEALNMKDNTVSARVNELLYETNELVTYPYRKSRVGRHIRIRPVGLPMVGQQELFQ